MIIKKRRIRSLKPYLRFFQSEIKVVVGITDSTRFSGTLKNVGFSPKLKNGDTVLPSGIFGSISKFNAEGKYIKHKDQPKETAYRTVEWHWKQWNGRYDTIPRTEFVDVSYKRYPRSFIPPMSVEMKVVILPNQNISIVSSEVNNIKADEVKLIHTINLFLEIFGECEFFTENLENIINVPLRRLNWKILPQGEMPWERLYNELKPIIEKAPTGNQPVIVNRLETITKYRSTFCYVGQAGFQGYVIFGFPQKNVVVLESMLYGNATYIFGEDWKKLSKRTKAEILNEKLQKDRYIHRKGWKDKIDTLLK